MTLSAKTTYMPTITTEKIEEYQKNGFVHIPRVLKGPQVAHYQKAALEIHENLKHLDNSNTAILDQFVNIWQIDPVLRELTLHPGIAAMAQKLAQVPLRLWHDHLLIKRPQNNAPTEWHQDQPYWPHENATHPISVWIALCDVPAEKGCMSFIPGSQKHTQLPTQNLGNSRSLFSLEPSLEWEKTVTVPLKAGDCTFHHGRTAHAAGANQTHDPRVAHVIIYMDETTTYNGQPHVTTDPLKLITGQKLQGDMFPLVNQFEAMR